MGKTEFKLGDDVVIKISGEVGSVTGIANYTEHATQYQVHYRDAHGCAKSEWFTAGQLTPR